MFETEEFRAWDLLLDPSTDSIILPRGDYFERLEFDADDGFVLSATMLEASFSRGGLIWAIDGNGDLYTDTYSTVINSKGNVIDEWLIARFDGATGELLDDAFADPSGAPNNYSYHKIGGFTFDAVDGFWLADFKKGKSPDGFISKANKKGKLPYKKRIAGWTRLGTTDTALTSLQTGLDGLLYAVVRTGPSGAEGIWSID